MSDSRSNIFEGRTLEEAVNKGLSALRLSRAEAMITVMQEGSSGFLGFGSRPFRVRMAARPGGAIREEETKEPRRVRSDRGGRTERGGRSGGRDRGGRGGERGGRDRGGDRATTGDRAASATREGSGSREGGGGRASSGDRAPRAERPAGRGDRRERPAADDRSARVPREEPREELRDEPVAQAGETRERVVPRPRSERGERGERGGRGGRRGRRDRGPREDRPARGPERQPLSAGDEPERPDERQPGFGMRGFEDRRRPGDRREEGGLPPSDAAERRTGDERRGERMDAGGDGVDGEGRRRRRGRRGGRRRHRGEEGATPEVMTAGEAMPVMDTGDDFAPVHDEVAPLDDASGDSEPGLYQASERSEVTPRRRGGDSGRRESRESRRSRASHASHGSHAGRFR